MRSGRSTATGVIATHARADQFVTGLLIRIRLADGIAELVNAGHPLPYLVRDGRPVMLDLAAELPLGRPNRALHGPGAPFAAR